MLSIAVIGAGFSGIGMTVALRKAGFDDVTVYERSHDVGGVWRDNTYPGAACDVASHLYSFSFAPEGRWSKRFAEQAEIHAYLRWVADDYGVLPCVRFSHDVADASWDGEHWTLTFGDGGTAVHDAVIAACGQLSRPSYPAVPGKEDFAGTAFHSARWDHAHDLAGRRVVVLGTGASAIQFVPEIAKQAVKAALARFPLLLTADRLRTFLINEPRSLGFNTDPRLISGHHKKFLRHLARQVTDPVLRAKLTPTDPMGCKRILQSNDWYPALCRPNVSVVTEAVTRVVPKGVVTADGVLHEADTLLYGTGFTATDLLAPMRISARGQSLSDAWSDGAEAYLGSAVAGFPNLFLLYGPNTNLGHNSIILMLESQFRWVTQALAQIPAGGSVEVRAEAQARFNTWLQKRLARTVFARGCQSWYLTAAGRNTQNWPGTTLDFRRRTRRLDPSVLAVRHPSMVEA
jgi:cation diffusion facilitator CzcD-associated flavoprotein CzcO